MITCNVTLAGYSITISKASNKLALYRDNELVRVFPVATGRHHSLTPEGRFSIVCKLVNPYYVRGQIPGGSPRNPLGPRWMGLSIGGGGAYGIHGNNNPASIGTYASGGCIRMHNHDVIWLFDRISTGTPVTINNIPLNLAKQPEPPPQPQPEPIKLRVGNIVPLPDSQSPEKNGEHIFIPLRPAAEELGYKLVWHRRHKIIEIRKEGKSTYIDTEGSSALVSGQLHRLPGIRFKNNVIYLPLEFFNHLAGITAKWNEKNREVNLVYK